MTTTIQSAVAPREKSIVEYVPYGSGDKVKLSVEIVQKLIAVPTRSGKTCSERDAIRFMAMCQAKRLSVFEGDCYLIGFDGKDGPQFSMFTAHQAFLKRAELHPEFDGMKSGLIVVSDGIITQTEGDFHLDTQEILGAWATVYFKTRKIPMHKTVRLSRFRKNFGVWLEDPAGMCVKVAECDSLRSAFPTMSGGLYLREELDASSFGITIDAPAPMNRKPSLELVAQTETVAADVKQEAENSGQVGKQSVREAVTGKERKLTKVDEAVANRTSVDAASPEPATRAEPTPQQSLEIYLDSAGVSWSDFRGFLISDGHFPAADSIATIDELPAEVCRKLAADAKAMSKLVKLYGGGKESVTP